MVDFTGGTWRSLIDGSEVSAIPDSVVLQPKTNDLDQFTGDTDSFEIQTSVSFGDEDETVEGERNGGDQTIVSTSGLDNYPSVNQRLGCLIQLSEDARIHIGFGVQSGDSSNRYEFSVREGDNQDIAIRKDGSVEDTDTATVDANTTYQLHWYWRDESPKIEGELFEAEDDPLEDSPLASVSLDDSEYTSGGISLKASAHTGESPWTMYWSDYYILEKI